MAIPDTTTSGPLFVTTPPAWEQRVRLEQAMLTDLVTSRAGLEQRQNRNSRGRFRLAYTAYYDADQAAVRRDRATAEIASVLWVPMWTEQATTAGAISSNRVSIDRPITQDWFTPGDWILFDSPTQGRQFRQIADQGVNDQQIVLEALTGAITFLGGTKAYPCRLCVREAGTADFEHASEATIMERLNYTTL